MPGERSYSKAAIDVLHAAYFDLGLSVDTILQDATAGELNISTPNLGNTKLHVAPTIQAELSQISRARAYELVRENPRYRHNQTRRVELIGEQLIGDIERQLQRSTEARFPNSAELVRLHHAYRSLKAELREEAAATPNKPPAQAGSAAQLLNTLTDTDQSS